ncbi:hypothetical protein [Streptomyces sp. F001]|uniref:hypothetical protein n=1 Tax=Streptomyces sp. F001 TaxID=1510026 RepID=UPI001F0EA01F|nr:hypothetical protein [Streptomyces sp. F001]
MSAIAWTAAGSLVAWLWLLLGQGFFWRTDVRLPPRTEPAVWPDVCVVVPARDEAEVLPASLPSLLAQDYPGGRRSSWWTTAARTAPVSWPAHWHNGTAGCR